ncbi:MAG: diadenylate cyclase CdaA [Spirochaetia bacterium]|nr:diadenylate cyclase CdaA [Spirochaetia bacterium]
MNLYENLQWGLDRALPVLDILLLSFIFYAVLHILQKVPGVRRLVTVSAVFLAFYAVAYILDLKTNLWVFNKLMVLAGVVIVVSYQAEFRQIFTQLGRSGFFGKSSPIAKEDEMKKILDALYYLSSIGRGALIVLERRMKLDHIISSGTTLNAEISFNLLCTIFEKDTHLHDGAVYIRQGKIEAAACFLPMSEQRDLRSSFGTRHRSALGMAENSDAVVLIVSEETQAVSLAYDANFFYDLKREELTAYLSEIFEFENIVREESESGNPTGIEHEK